MSNEVLMAERELAAAQDRLEAARKHQADMDTFPVTGKVFAVMAKVPTFHQFVSYSNEGLLVAVFATEDEAVRYTRTFRAPTGTDFQVEPMDLRG